MPGKNEVRHTQSGTAVVNLNLATNTPVKRNGEWQEETEWHRIVAWGRLAEICGEYLSTGPHKKVCMIWHEDPCINGQAFGITQFGQPFEEILFVKFVFEILFLSMPLAITW